MSKATRWTKDENLTEREHRILGTRSTLKAAGRCTLCPPHRGENRTDRKRNAGQKPRRKNVRRSP